MQSSPEPRYARSTNDLQIEAVLAATRELIWVCDARDARRIAVDLIRSLGGAVTYARDETSDQLPIDVSFGIGAPLVPIAPRPSVAYLLLARHLPGFVRDASRALELARRCATEVPAGEASDVGADEAGRR